MALVATLDTQLLGPVFSQTGFPEVKREIGKGLERVGNLWVNETKRRLGVGSRRFGRDTSELWNSIQASTRFGQRSFQVSVGTPVVYGPVIELGRTPGSRMPPPLVIEQWLIRKRGLSPDEARRVRFVVARAIARNGFAAPYRKGARAFERAERFNRAKVQGIVDDAISNAVLALGGAGEAT